jgi:hypothetical protein
MEGSADVDTLTIIAACGASAAAVARPLFKYLTLRDFVKHAPPKHVRHIAEAVYPPHRFRRSAREAASTPIGPRDPMDLRAERPEQAQVDQ